MGKRKPPSRKRTTQEKDLLSHIPKVPFSIWKAVKKKKDECEMLSFDKQWTKAAAKIDVLEALLNDFKDETANASSEVEDLYSEDYTSWVVEQTTLMQDFIFEQKDLISSSIKEKDSSPVVLLERASSEAVMRRNVMAEMESVKVMFMQARKEHQLEEDRVMRELNKKVQCLSVNIYDGTEGNESLNSIQGAGSVERPLVNVEKDKNVALTNLQHASTCFVSDTPLPKNEVPLFNGDPLEYNLFISAFDYKIANRLKSDQDKLHYLEQYTTGKPKTLIRSCFYLPPKEGYALARKTLDEKFGNTLKLSEAHLKQLRKWPMIREEDGDSMEQFAVFLKSILNAMSGIGGLAVLNNPDRLLDVLDKLSLNCKKKWRVKNLSIRQNEKRFPIFSDIVKFVEDEAEELNDPIFGKIQGNDCRQFMLLQKTNETRQTRHKALLTTTTTKPLFCNYCRGAHHITVCKEFSTQTHELKKQHIKKNGLCYFCLKAGHVSKDCYKPLKCSICTKMHPDALHRNFAVQKADDKPASKSETSLSVVEAKAQKISFAVVPVLVKTKDRMDWVRTNAALDPFSSTAFISSNLVSKLELKPEKAKISLSTMHGCKESIQTKVVPKFLVSDMKKKSFVSVPFAYTTDEMPVTKRDLPTKLELSKYEHLKGVPYACLQEDIGLLLGVNTPAAVKPLEVVTGQAGEPYALRTCLGWTINGPLSQTKPTREVSLCTGVCDVSSMAQTLYNKEFTDQPKSECRSWEDTLWRKKVEKETVHRNGQYEVPMPFKSRIVFPNNREQVRSRLEGLKKKFLQNVSFGNDYRTFMNSMIEKKFVSRVEKNEEDSWFIPHHGIYHPHKPGKIRVVFDCAAKFNGISLNDNLLQGPGLANSLFGVLLRFREKSVAIACDIESMFYCVRMPDRDAQKLRFLWWENPLLMDKVVEFCINVHLFGAKSSPSIANYALQRVATDFKGKYSDDVCKIINDNFYVDDCLISFDNDFAAEKQTNELVALCKEAGFKLGKFKSNKKLDFLNNNCKDGTKEILCSQETSKNGSVLGIEWDTKSDSFRVNPKNEIKNYTRRGILSVVAGIYDPFGFFAPFTLVGKLIVQRLFRETKDWDESLTCKLKESFTFWYTQVPLLKSFAIERQLLCKIDGKCKLELHHFSDASSKGYGCVSYLSILSSSKIATKFLMAKARCAPLKEITVPRLELVAAVLAVESDTLLKNELRLRLSKSVFWTDSRSVLLYIQNEAKRFQTFVANRIQRIRDKTSPEQWHHVPGKVNPADLASRGASVTDLIAGRLWFNGPDFLSKQDEDFPQFQMQANESCKLEFKAKCLTTKLDTCNNATDLLVSHFSSLSKLKRSLAWFLRFFHYLKTKEVPREKWITLAELKHAEKKIIKYEQRKYFSQEIGELANGKPVNGRSPLRKLDPFLDDFFIRVGGRLRASDVPFHQKHPLILPKESNVSVLILREIHETSGQMGRNFVISKSRETVWILQVGIITRKLLGSCLVCQRLFKSACKPKMADLPKERVDFVHPPFTFVGTDMFGPIKYKRFRKELNCYGCIFTCLSSRAVHLELCESLDTDSFLSALKRFVCRRGPVKVIWSDNGSNFKGAQKFLKDALDMWNKKKLSDSMVDKGVEWKFNPALAPHFGGSWERLIGLVKRILYNILRDHLPTFEILSTFFCEVERIMNSRPLTQASDDINDTTCLSPNTFLFLKEVQVSSSLKDTDWQYARKRWKFIQGLSHTFWCRFRKEYLTHLSQRHKWEKSSELAKQGDIVLIKDEGLGRNSWPLGRVQTVMKGPDGVCRSAVVKTLQGTYHRPMHKLIKLQM